MFSLREELYHGLMKAIYEAGVLRPSGMLDLDEGEQVEVEVRRLETGGGGEAAGRGRALERLRRGLHLGGQAVDRETLHER